MMSCPCVRASVLGILRILLNSYTQYGLAKSVAHSFRPLLRRKILYANILVLLTRTTQIKYHLVPFIFMSTEVATDCSIFYEHSNVLSLISRGLWLYSMRVLHFNKSHLLLAFKINIFYHKGESLREWAI